MKDVGIEELKRKKAKYEKQDALSKSGAVRRSAPAQLKPTGISKIDPDPDPDSDLDSAPSGFFCFVEV